METLLTVLMLVHAPPAFELQTLGGEVIAGPLLEVAAKRITVQTADGPVPVEIEQLASLVPVRAPLEFRDRPGAWIDLSDGSALVASDYTVSNDQARITMFNGQVAELPVDQIVAIRFRPNTETVTQEWLRLMEMSSHDDLLVVHDGDSIEYHAGVLGDVTETLVHFELDGEVLPIKRAKLHGLIHYRSKRPDSADAFCRMVDVDGSQWVVQSLALAEDAMHWTTVSGLEITRPLSAVVRVDFSQGKVVYLTDLTPESVAWTPFLGGEVRIEVLRHFFEPREDRGLRSARPLELEGRSYSRGLAMHSRTQLEYRLPGQFRRFKALAGIDDRVRPAGNARLVVRGDNRVLLDTPIAGTDPAMPIDLDLTGVHKLTILVDFGEDLDVADHVDLCEARVIK